MWYTRYIKAFNCNGDITSFLFQAYHFFKIWSNFRSQWSINIAVISQSISNTVIPNSFSIVCTNAKKNPYKFPRIIRFIYMLFLQQCCQAFLIMIHPCTEFCIFLVRYMNLMFQIPVPCFFPLYGRKFGF